MGLCVLYYVENSLYNVKKVGLFFYLGWNYTLNNKTSTLTRSTGLCITSALYKFVMQQAKTTKIT